MIDNLRYRNSRIANLWSSNPQQAKTFWFYRKNLDAHVVVTPPDMKAPHQNRNAAPTSRCRLSCQSKPWPLKLASREEPQWTGLSARACVSLASSAKPVANWCRISGFFKARQAWFYSEAERRRRDATRSRFTSDHYARAWFTRASDPWPQTERAGRCQSGATDDRLPVSPPAASVSGARYRHGNHQRQTPASAERKAPHAPRPQTPNRLGRTAQTPRLPRNLGARLARSPRPASEPPLQSWSPNAAQEILTLERTRISRRIVSAAETTIWSIEI